MKITKRLRIDTESEYMNFSALVADSGTVVRFFTPNKVFELGPYEAEEMANLFNETAAALREVAKATRQNEVQNGDQANYQADNQTR